MADGDADTKPKPTSFTYTCDYTKRDSNIPFVSTYRHSAGSYTNVLQTGTISDFSEGTEGGGFEVTMRVPRAYPHSNAVTYTEYVGTGSCLDNLSWTQKGSADNAFLQGLNNGISVGLSNDITAGVAAAIAKQTIKGITVLGKYPSYTNLSNVLASNKFQIPQKVWKSMSETERQAANFKYLDRAVARGDNFWLSNRVTNINSVRGAFREELEYMIKTHGYKLSSDGLRLIK
jgi:hypothetical protein